MTQQVRTPNCEARTPMFSLSENEGACFAEISGYQRPCRSQRDSSLVPIIARKERSGVRSPPLELALDTRCQSSQAVRQAYPSGEGRVGPTATDLIFRGGHDGVTCLTHRRRLEFAGVRSPSV